MKVSVLLATCVVLALAACSKQEADTKAAADVAPEPVDHPAGQLAREPA